MKGGAVTASEQLQRLLLVLPTLADDAAHSIGELAKRVGTSEDVIIRDLRELVTRTGDEPGGFTEGVSLLLGRDSVQLQTPAGHFRRPMALTRSELHALELGLAMLAQESPPEDLAVIGRARERLRKALTRMPADEDASDARVASLSAETAELVANRRLLQRCIRERRVARLRYRSATSTQDDERDVQPLGLVWSRGQWYLAAWCRRSDGLRVFRLDRIAAAAATDERFDAVDGFQLDHVLRDGRVLSPGEGANLRLRYSPRIARWIHEREGGSLDADGSLTVEYEAHQEEWALRQVLRYGPDAIVLEPEALRHALCRKLQAMPTLSTNQSSHPK